jgi:hypothetical protein
MQHLPRHTIRNSDDASYFGVLTRKRHSKVNSDNDFRLYRHTGAVSAQEMISKNGSTSRPHLGKDISAHILLQMLQCLEFVAWADRKAVRTALQFPDI